MNIISAFAQTLVNIDSAIVTKQQIDFDRFIIESDEICSLAMKQGDVVPSSYINILDKALSEYSDALKGKYIEVYNLAVARYEHFISNDIERLMLPEYLSSLDNAEYEEYMAYADYRAITFATRINQHEYETCRNTDDTGLLRVVSNEHIEACHWIDVVGDLVRWKVKFENQYFQFIGFKGLGSGDIMQIINKKPH